jgi:hypothetical protein
MPDQIEKLFADLRADTLPTVRLPGTEPLRRAARRRRAVISGAAAVTVLGLAALIAVVRPDSAPEPVASPPPSSSPYFTDAVLTERITETLKLDDPMYAGLSDVRLSGTPASQRSVLGGTYDVRTTCYGSGSIEIIVNGTVARSIPCDPVGTLWTTSVVVPESHGQLTVMASPGRDDTGRAPFGYVADLAQADKTRWQGTASNTLDAETDAFVSGSFFASGDGGTGYDNSDVEAGPYRVRVICFGYGTVRLAAGPGDSEQPPTKQTTVRCSPDNPRSGSLTVTASTGGLSYLAEPDADAGHRAAVATALERI